MKKMFAVVFLLFAAVSFAQSVGSVILVSDVTSVDMLIAKAAGEKTGMPVLVLPDGALNDEIRAQLTSLGVKTIVLVGGPAVIKEDTQTELEAKYSVVRLWGHERTGTAVEVAKYFWNGGADCVVVADDTKDSNNDTTTQTEASESASSSGCPFIPVPKGTIPADVLDVINSLGVKEAKFVGNEFSGEFRIKLAKLRLREITGSDDDIAKKVDDDANVTGNRSLRLIIIAAPHWRDVLGYGGHRGRHTLVRIVSDVNQTPRLVELIKTKSINDVRVLGKPSLAEEIAAALAAEGINATKVSGSSDEVGRKMLDDTMDEWEDKIKEYAAENAALRTKIRARLTERLSELEERLTSLESELASKNAEGAEASEVAGLQNKIDAAKKQLDAIKTYIDNNNLETANIRIAKLFDDVERARWRGRNALKISDDDEIDDEEDSLEDNDKIDISSVENRLFAIRNKCNITSLDLAIEKAKALKQGIMDARAAGDYAKAGELSRELKALVERARNLANVCEKMNKLDGKLTEAAKKASERAEKIRTESDDD